MNSLALAYTNKDDFSCSKEFASVCISSSMYMSLAKLLPVISWVMIYQKLC